jgi:hypothetical protein
MPDSKISALPSATVPLAGTEVLPIVQSSVTDKVTAADLLRQNGQTVTTSNPVLSLAQTWNAGGVTFTGLLFNATSSASASASLLMDLQVGGTSAFKVDRTGIVTATGTVVAPILAFNASSDFLSTSGGYVYVRVNGADRFAFGPSNQLQLRSDGSLGWTVGTSPTTSPDLFLYRDAPGALALRNGTNAQTFNLYGTYTSSTNYERVNLAHSSGAFQLMAEKGSGGGSARSLYLGTNATLRWYLDGSLGHLLAATDNTYDIGASGATRPRNVFVAGTGTFGGDLTSAGSVVCGSGSGFNFGTARGSIQAASDGVFRLLNNAGTDFSRLQFGGTTNSFPALKRSGGSLDVRFADDSGDATLNAGVLRSAGSVFVGYGTAIPAGGSNGIGLKGTSATNFGVFFGSGAPTLSAAKGSLYLRSDGSGTGDRMYVNTDGSTTWTAVTTAA